MIEQHDLRDRAAYRLVKLSRLAYRYQAVENYDGQLHVQLNRLATDYPRYGYMMQHSLHKTDGLVFNNKRTYRLYTE